MYVSASRSLSVAVTGKPMGRPGGVSSGKLRAVEESANAGPSGTSRTLMVTWMVALAPLGSDARTVTA